MNVLHRETNSLLSAVVHHRVGHHEGKCFTYYKICCIPFGGAILVLVWSLLLNSAALSSIVTLYIQTYFSITTDYKIYMLLTQSAFILTLLLYPIAGLLAETLFTRFKFMIAATVIAMIGLILVVPVIFFKGSSSSSLSAVVTVSLLTIGLIVRQVGLGMFKANAIQFGVDQLQFANNEDLSKFIQWYFWSVFVTQYTPDLILSPLSNAHSALVLFGQAIFGIICIIITLLLVICSTYRRSLLIEPTSTSNPVTLIYNVLNYARHHYQPAWRSAMTYGAPPPFRIDLAKELYGGPFTTEQVEDVKSFWRILGLLMTLFGVFLVPGILQNIGFVLLKFNESFGKDSVSLHVVANYFQSACYMLIIFCIPVYLGLFRPCFSLHRCTRNLRGLSMLNKMAFGLIMTCIALTLSTICSAVIYNKFHSNQVQCFSISNITCSNTEVSIIAVSFISAQVFSAFGYILVFLTGLEFILAQAPRTMQGLLIGLLYACQSLGIAIYLAINLTQVKLQCHYWPYFATTILSIASLCLYIMAFYRFKYRQRQELTNVNYQYIIEEYTARQIEEQDRQKAQQPTVDDYNIIDD